MQPDTQPTPATRGVAYWLGWIIGIVPCLLLIWSGVMKLTNPQFAEGMPKMGWSASSAHGLGLVEIGCTLLYLFPPTSLLGAILLTGYLGGAAATHVRLGDQPFMAIGVGALLWLGLLLRDGGLRAMLPWGRDPGTSAGGAAAVFGKFVLVVGVLILLAIGLIAAMPEDFRIVRSTTIDAPPSEVFPYVNDFRKWSLWSPWEKMDPGVKKTFEGPSSGTGAIYKWEGEKTGQGTMTLVESRPNELVRIRLDFKEPREDSADVVITFKEDNGKTLVTWTMEGKSDLIGKAISAVMNLEKMVGGSFEEGLRDMKAVVEAKKQ